MFHQYSKYLFPFFLITSILAALAVIFPKIKRMGFSKKAYNRLIITMTYGGIAIYLGARMFDNLFHYIDYQVNLANGLNPTKPLYEGITYLGGYVTGISVFVALFVIFMKDQIKQLPKLLSTITLGFILAHAIGRIGCYVAGCCYGNITTSFLGVIFPKGSPAYSKLVEYFSHDHSQAEAINLALKTKILPTQLIESVFLFGLFGVLSQFKKNQFQYYLISYGVFRFIIEFFRFDNRGALLGFISPSQTICLLMICLGTFLLVKEAINKKKVTDSVPSIN